MPAASVILKQLEIGPMANYVYLLADPGTRDAAVIDPAWDVPAILSAAEREGLRLRAAIVTHKHFDHTNGIPDLLGALDIPVYVHAQDAPEIKGAGGNLKRVLGGDAMALGALRIEFLHTPGHTAGSQCLRVGDALLTGDTLFIDGCGRVDLPGSDPAEMQKSLERLAELPGRTVIWPGHDYSEEKHSLLRSQLESNPYLRMARQNLRDFMHLVGR